MIENKTILIVDDEFQMRTLLSIYLKDEGFELSEASTGKEAITKIQNSPEQYDLIILDIMMPDLDGFEVCKIVREYSTIPILMLSARKALDDRVDGLNLGADDYLTKPFEPEELIARVKALLRRVTTIEAKQDEVKLAFEDGLTIYYDNRSVYVNNELVELTAKEFELLYKLALNPQRVYTRDDLLYLIWGEDYVGAQRTVDSHIKNIRSKLYVAGLKNNRIITVWGVGYKFL
ncbi:response regulator transcription factor [Halalkalibacter flavus]|uniref:response regulator transcription factor n=1 Tax=Halalkalibacter flavus TaxID=3090668 RepID=UPI002FC6931D